MKKLMLFVLAAVIALAAVPATLAYDSITPTPYYWSGQTRMGSYSSTWSYNQGFYDYLSPPVAQTRYGASYHWGSNVRWPVYPEYPARVSCGYRPYGGYPYTSCSSPYNGRYSNSYYGSYGNAYPRNAYTNVRWY